MTTNYNYQFQRNIRMQKEKILKSTFLEVDLNQSQYSDNSEQAIRQICMKKNGISKRAIYTYTFEQCLHSLQTKTLLS